MRQMAFVFGPNGSGKGTLCQNIESKIRFLHVNLGNLIREYISRNNRIDLAETINRGNLIDDEIVSEIIFAHDAIQGIEFSPYKGILFEGFPRQRSQIEILKKLIKYKKIEPLFYIELVIDLETIINRIKYRVIAPDGKTYNLMYNPPPKDIPEELLQKRQDDDLYVAQQRYERYQNLTKPCLSDPFFIKLPKLIIDARQSIEDIQRQALEFIQKII